MEEKEMPPLLSSLLFWSSVETSRSVGVVHSTLLSTALLLLLLVCLSRGLPPLSTPSRAPTPILLGHIL